MIREIKSQDNQTIRLIKKLKDKKYRDAESAYLIEGPNLLNEAINNNEDILAVVLDLESKAAKDIIANHNLDSQTDKVISVNSKLLKSLTDTVTPQGVLAVIKKRQNESSGGFNRFVVLDELQDPGNVGTIIRTAEAANFTGVISVKGTVDFYSSKVIRAAAGSMFRIDLIELDSKEATIEYLKEKEVELYVCDIDADIEYTDTKLTSDIGFVIGNEGNGVSAFFKERCTKVKIPMKEDTESLNASVAAGIMIYESVRQRKKDQ